MSADDYRKAGCTGKKTYGFTQAKQLAHKVSQRHDEPMQHYHCTWCHGWHLGQPNRAGKRKRRAETITE
jgi:hypothetical protein